MRLIFVFILSFYVSSAFSADYSWLCGVSGCTAQPTPFDAGQQYFTPGIGYSAVSGVTLTVTSCSKLSDTSFRCYASNQDGVPGWYTDVARSGDACQEGSVYDPETGGCSASDPCLAKANTSHAFVKSGHAPDEYMALTSSGKGASSQSGCFEGCAASTADQKCTVRVSGDYLCRGTAWFTGTACSVGPETDAPVGPSDTSDYPVPQTITEDKPCVYAADGSGGQTCLSQKSNEQEGLHCGTFNGAALCVDADPGKNGLLISTQIKKTTNPDGSTQTTKTDTATKTVCTAIQKCSEKTTTTTTVINKTAGGAVTGQSSSCTGDNCGEAEDANGGSNGNCTEGETCETPPNFEPEELEEVPGFGDALTGFMDKIEAAPFIAGVSNISVPTGGSCSFPSAQTPVGTISLDAFCDLASVLDQLSAVFLAMWGFAAIRVLMSA